eukprot:jgi/Phyca11/505879/fgenesh2_kg.PHYCAscaffold_16_\
MRLSKAKMKMIKTLDSVYIPTTMLPCEQPVSRALVDSPAMKNGVSSSTSGRVQSL